MEQDPFGRDELLRDLLTATLVVGGTDLHLRVGQPPMIRKNGELTTLNDQLITENDMEGLKRSAISEEQNKTLYKQRSVDLDYQHKDNPALRFRANFFILQNQVAAVFRLLPTNIPRLSEIEAPKNILPFCNLQRGLVLVTGTTGSGKSTTLAAIIDQINSKRAAHIITIEDPIEFRHNPKRSLITQREVRQDATDFVSAFRDALRQDPDVILVGELRSPEICRLALNAAETGHLVLASLGTRDPADTVQRMIDQFPGTEQQFIRTQLASALEGVISQRLLPRKDGAGRVAAFEVLNVSPALRASIRSGSSGTELPTILQVDKASLSFERSVAQLVREGKVSDAVADEQSLDAKELRARINGESPGRVEMISEGDLD